MEWPWDSPKSETDPDIEECIKKYETEPDSNVEEYAKKLKESCPVVREFMEEFEIPDFTGNVGGVVKNGTWKKFSVRGLEEELRAIKIYPNGNEPENEGYVSIVIEIYNHAISPMASMIQDGYYSSFQCIASVVDANGDPRFAQSFGRDLKEWSFESLFTLEVDRFVGRNVLLHSSEELLPNDTLKIHCYVALVYISMDKYKAACVKIMDLRAENEQWFVNHDSVNGEYMLFNLRNADSPLCKKLREKSEFFRCLFISRCKEMKDGFMPVSRREYGVFFNMLGYIRTGTLQHVVSNSEHYDLYKVADMYGVLGLKEICRAYFKQQLTSENAILTLAGADSVNDFSLRTYAFRRVLSNWKQVRESSDLDWKILRQQKPDLAKELTCTARILNLDNDVGLGKLAARQVLLNWKLVRNSPYWSVFAKKLPDLSKVVLCLVQNVPVLNVIESKPVDEYKEHAIDYDFYV